MVSAWRDRWLEIHDTTGRLITVLEWLSPSNQLESDERDRYRVLNYRLDLEAPPASEEADWVDQVLREHALR